MAQSLTPTLSHPMGEGEACASAVVRLGVVVFSVLPALQYVH